jgi:hypothetical protein
VLLLDRLDVTAQLPGLTERFPNSPHICTYICHFHSHTRFVHRSQENKNMNNYSKLVNSQNSEKTNENHKDAITITRCSTQRNTNLKAVRNFQHGRTYHHGSEDIRNFKGYIDNSMVKTFTLLSVKGDREPRITNNTQDAAKTTLG